MKTPPIKSLFKKEKLWAAEFLEDSIRLLQLTSEDGKLAVTAKFNGNYEEAEVFALKNHLKWDGVYGAISHLPYKINQLVNAGADDSEFQEERERLRPKGLPESDFAEAFVGKDNSLSLVQYLDENLEQFKTSLPPNLSTLNSFALSPLVAHQYLEAQNAIALNSITCIFEESHTHCLIYGKAGLIECVDIPFGRDLLKDSPELFGLELKKLEWYSITSEKSATVPGFRFFSNSIPEVEEKCLENTNIKWDKIVPAIEIESGFLVPALLCWLQMNAKNLEEPTSSYVIGSHNSHISENQGLWKRRTFSSLKYFTLAIGIVGLSYLVLLFASFALNKLTEKDRAKLLENIQHMEKIRQTKETIKLNMEKLSAVLAEKSRVSEDIQKIALGLPDKTWLKAIETNHVREKGHIYFVSGYCFQERKVSEILGGLERQNFSDVKLKYTERIAGEKIKDLTGLTANKQDLIEFAILIRP